MKGWKPVPGTLPASFGSRWGLIRKGWLWGEVWWLLFVLLPKQQGKATQRLTVGGLPSNDGKMTVSSTLFVVTSLWYPPVYSDRKVFCQDSPMVHCKLHYHTSLYLGAAIIRYSLPGNSAFPNVITFTVFYSTESLQLWRISYYPGHISFYKGQDWVVFSFVCNTVKITVQALPL